MNYTAVSTEVIVLILPILVKLPSPVDATGTRKISSRLHPGTKTTRSRQQQRQWHGRQQRLCSVSSFTAASASAILCHDKHEKHEKHAGKRSAFFGGQGCSESSGDLEDRMEWGEKEWLTGRKRKTSEVKVYPYSSSCTLRFLCTSTGARDGACQLGLRNTGAALALAISTPSHPCPVPSSTTPIIPPIHPTQEDQSSSRTTSRGLCPLGAPSCPFLTIALSPRLPPSQTRPRLLGCSSS